MGGKRLLAIFVALSAVFSVGRKMKACRFAATRIGTGPACMQAQMTSMSGGQNQHRSDILS
jgi:hypothetical protein